MLAKQLPFGAEQRTAHLGVRVFQAEVQVARSGHREGDLASIHNSGKLPSSTARLGVEPADAVDVACFEGGVLAWG